MSYTDKTEMPFGKYKGIELANVPANYLLWLNQSATQNQRRWNPELYEYINENLDALQLEVNNAESVRKYNNRYNTM